ncbi:MAG: tRNA (guanine(37)-N(1))-methyltransferase [Alphaproteobacteria bacterium]|nr:tRNA (guanine(37)-N(1))-methyltransferase [Alphaproteobacteria bacterium]
MTLFSAITLTLFPDMFPGPLGHSLAGKALEKGIWSLQTLDLRDFALDKHRTVDDSPYGGGTGMVMKPDVLAAALDHAKTLLPGATLIYPSPRGVPITQALIQQLVFGHGSLVNGKNAPKTKDQQPKTPSVILLCGRFEGIDQRIIDHYGLLEVSLGDFVLSGGEIAALAILDAAVRLLPGVIGNDEATKNDSFSLGEAAAERAVSGAPCDFQKEIAGAAKNSGNHADFGRLLEYPHYTRPPDWNGLGVPEVLLSGDHEKIKNWRLQQAKDITRARRPDLLK